MWRWSTWWRSWPALALALLVACGGVQATPTVAPTATAAPTPTIDLAPTQTRAAELAQLATLTAPTATPTATPVPPTATATTAPPTPTSLPNTPTPRPLPATQPQQGRIVFGPDYRSFPGGFEVVELRTNFQPGETAAFVAHFREPAGATSVERFVVSVSPTGSEMVRDRAQIPIADPTGAIFAGRLTTTNLGTGRYVLRFIRGATVLAEGAFTIVP